ncbi:MFS transporter [Legionella sp. W05-934-2]|uniref:MFS transporter n=1 Tax=Legionella sp. W05-934-2 TaxID=1198649 RepID=UPI0034628967
MTDFLLSYAKKYTKNYEGLPSACWQGIILIGINAFTIGICFFLSLYFVNAKQFTPSTSGLLLSCYGIGTVAGGIIAGKFSDTISPRIISIISLLMQSNAFFLLIFLQSALALMPNLILLGFAAYGFKTSNNTWMLNQCNNDSNLRYKTISISHVASNCGLGLSGILIACLVTYGFKSIFYLSSFVLICAAFYLLTQLQGVKTSSSIKENYQFKKVSRNKQIVTVLTCVFLIGLIIAQLGSTYPLYIQASFPILGVQGVSILFLLDTFLIVLFQAPLTNLLSEQNKFLVTGTGALLMGFGMLVLCYASNFSLAIISCIIWTTGEMLFVSTAQLLCYESSQADKKGQSLGLFQSVFALSNIIGPVLGSSIYQYWGGYLLWYISGGIGILCFMLCWNMTRTHAHTPS